jgi:hypothetical protein
MRDSTPARNDLQPAATHTDYRINRTAQPAPAGMEELLRQAALWNGHASDQLAGGEPAEKAPAAARPQNIYAYPESKDS